MDQRLFVTSLIREYYRNAGSLSPDHVEEREFGVGTFETKIFQRHMGFASDSALTEYLVREAPPYVSYSAAYYKRPTARPMENKGFLGAELVFDLDATDMNLPCQKVHGASWVCENCLDSVKAETIRLIEDFLIPDFGISKNELQVNFSGNRGYHVHVKSKEVFDLDANARKQITDYIAGIGIKFEEVFPTTGQRGTALIGPKPTDFGWRGRIARNFISIMEKGPEAIMALSIDRRTAAMLYRKRALIEMGIKRGNWDMVYIKNKNEFWKGILERMAVAQSNRIDRNVTNEPTHLIRLPNTIHGETGLVAKKIDSIGALSGYDPMKECIAFRDGMLKIHVTESPALIMGGEAYGPFQDSMLTVPTYVGVYLYLKGRAEILQKA